MPGQTSLLSGYRVGQDGDKFRDRLPLWIRDQQRVFSEVMPLAAQRCGMTDTEWIGEASRYNLTRYLARASREFAPDGGMRASTALLFQAWGMGSTRIARTGAKWRSTTSPTVR